VDLTHVSLDDPAAGLINGELMIPGSLLRREVFDPVVEQVMHSKIFDPNITLIRIAPPKVLKLIEEQTRRVEQCIDALLLVGGFSGSEYLFKRVDVRVLGCN
jgi:hypothetical protein